MPSPLFPNRPAARSSSCTGSPRRPARPMSGRRSRCCWPTPRITPPPSTGGCSRTWIGRRGTCSTTSSWSGWRATAASRSSACPSRPRRRRPAGCSGECWRQPLVSPAVRATIEPRQHGLERGQMSAVRRLAFARSGDLALRMSSSVRASIRRSVSKYRNAHLMFFSSVHAVVLDLSPSATRRANSNLIRTEHAVQSHVGMGFGDFVGGRLLSLERFDLGVGRFAALQHGVANAAHWRMQSRSSRAYSGTDVPSF